MNDKKFGCLMGGIVGDAFGSPYQFRQRYTYEITDDMEFCKIYEVPAGSFTDDSSMMLCLAQSLTDKNGFDPKDQMEKYADWLEYGYMSSIDKAFDVGNTTASSVGKYVTDRSRNNISDIESYGLTDDRRCGNAGIMRLGPIPVFYSKYEDAIKYARLSSAVTHAHEDCLDCAGIMSHVVFKLLHGCGKHEALDVSIFENSVSENVKRICRGEYKNYTRDQIRTTGYVVDTLEAAMWALYVTNSYEEGMKLLARMGNDVDTVCCVFGQLAGAYYGSNGSNGVPERWIHALQKRDMVNDVINNFISQ
ncbi:ADP-ribosylglycohydrolase [Only Syngen Nebraska virus 5]|uniref:ADP-ribosylglycohydrolase n=1 Tax=Only Syngen Nebraska virus 5 TaxID=1917232 RepID=UPI0009012C7D|nr:ADP-ribosylglycohydrolase [Only Syngen Nebraska virus 5]APC25821.1 ADP-ribosylglycohydrolase [Only Syngen Nebraska virus 5]